MLLLIDGVADLKEVFQVLPGPAQGTHLPLDSDEGVGDLAHLNGNLAGNRVGRFLTNLVVRPRKAVNVLLEFVERIVRLGG